METQSPEDHIEKAEAANGNYHSNIDNSRPFRSVKEAVAIFGERFLAGEIYAPKRFAFPQQETPVCCDTPSPSPQKSQETSWKSFTSPQKSSFDDCNEQPMFMESLRKLEAELEETKKELRILKERESETEVALASLNAELHKNMSKLAQAEAVAAASKALAAATASRSNSVVHERNCYQDQEKSSSSSSSIGFGQEEKRRDLIVRLESSTTLAQFLNAGENRNTTTTTATTLKEDQFYHVGMMKKEKKLMKKKPIIPLVGDLFSRKKGNSTTMHNPLFASSHMRNSISREEFKHGF